MAGIDGSAGALDAAHWAAHAARRFHEPLHLTRVVDARRRITGETPHGPELEQAEQSLDEAARASGNGYGDLSIERSVQAGSPAKALENLSRTARMVVLGPADTTEMQSVFTGSDVVHVANHAHCPVAVWRGEPGPDEPDRRPVVVGVDGSPLSDSAVEHAFECAAFFGAPLVAVHTWPEQSTLGGLTEKRRFTDWTAHEQHEAAMLAQSLSGWCEKYPDVVVTRCVERGGPMRALLEHSVEAQLVVVGSHGRHPFTASIIGSTSQSLIHRSRCPVLVCRDR